jgi:hypothetical protein
MLLFLCFQLVITGRPVFPALEQMAGNLIQFRDRFSNSDHQSNQFPSTDPPRNIRGFEYISFTDWSSFFSDL